ncbi:MAG: DHH family phosphoesterase, partial [Pseudomonadales bacterium]
MGASGIQARILAGRLPDSAAENLAGLFTPHLKHLVSPNRLADIQAAVERLAHAVMHGERIGILTDYDVDGVTSHLVLLTALRDHFGVDHAQLDSFIGHRIHDGYGISENLVERILNQPQRPAVIITADCGSSDQPRIKLLAEAGVDVIVGDHHAIPSEGIPSSALAVVNPTRADCDYPDSSIAGVMVSWLIMSALRAKLIDLK